MVRVGGQYVLRVEATPVPTLRVTGRVIAARPHAETITRTLYYFHTTHISELQDGADEQDGATVGVGRQTSARRRVMHLSTNLSAGGGHIRGGGTGVGEPSWRNDLCLSHHCFTSVEGYTYRYDGWYDATDLQSEQAAEADGESGSMSSLSSVLVPDEWLDLMEKDTAACEVRYLCYTFRPWFSSPFHSLGYLPLAEKGVCHSVYLCHRCLTPFFAVRQLTVHLHGYCPLRRPPGTLIYDDVESGRRVYHVDGAQHLHYARCISLLGKCFIESKLLHNDVDIYELFIVTLPRRELPYIRDDSGCFACEDDFRRAAAEYDVTQGWNGDVVVGYFSRLKHRPNHALSCIVTLPLFQRARLGSFMLDIAYHLTCERQRQCGCGECCGRRGDGGAISRPFSPQGQALLLSYWRRALLRAAWRRVERGAGNDFASIDDLVRALDLPIHKDDVLFFLRHDGSAFYSTTASASVTECGAASGEDVAQGTQSGVMLSLVFDEAVAQRVADEERDRVLMLEGRDGGFHVKWMRKDDRGASVYTKRLFHYS